MVKQNDQLPAHAMFIDGAWVQSRSGHALPVVDPSTEQTVATIAAGSVEDVDFAVQAATDAAPGWAALAWTERASALRELAGRIQERAEELALMDTVDSGNPISGMRGDALSASSQLQYFAGLGGEVKGSTIPWSPTQFAHTLREPYGVVGRITAFNHPLLFAASKSAGALLAGNAVVLKPSEHTSLSSLELAAMAADLIPSGTLNVVTGTGSCAGAALTEHPDVPRVAFTGGVNAGRAVLRAGAEQIKHVTVELGGKNPMIVFPEVNVRAAAAAAVAGMNLCRSMGQSCQSTSRILVHEQIADRFTETLAELVEGLRVGDPRREDVDMGPLAFRAHYERVMSYLEIATAEGAMVVTGGGRPPGIDMGYYVLPTVLSEVTPQMRVANEEIFGPVISILTWESYDDMLGLANSLPYGLTANVWTNDLSTAHRTVQQLQAGTVWVNGDGNKPAGVPFGGYKQSGLGKEGCLEELFSYTREKSVIVNLQP